VIGGFMARMCIDINESLIKDGLKLTGLGTKKELVNYALEDLIKKIKRKSVLKFEGKIVWQGDLCEKRSDK
jgi:Arc/MetJ family transcription regulator